MDAVLEPPERFGVVAPQVYRSSVFHPVNFAFVSGLRLKTIVHLSPEVMLRAVSGFIQDNSIELVHLGLKFWTPTGWRPIREELIKEALEIVLDADRHPLMLMCTSGIHQTGTVVGCLRRVQRHSFTSIIDELRSFALPAQTRYTSETFIEFFDTDVVSLPDALPVWFDRAPPRLPRAPQGAAYQSYLLRVDGPLVQAWLKDRDDQGSWLKLRDLAGAGESSNTEEEDDIEVLLPA